ncbi:hypothetical protein L195_g060336 [Trifolium pratense]|uniref:Uncharacterized protein n=1 Tax=Trifolium pratense TaxID=57577 RepID=A0A2K3K386_TRIPR|nr:hypothetical protein L195_g060336 [Trifolium pratense]
MHYIVSRCCLKLKSKKPINRALLLHNYSFLSFHDKATLKEGESLQEERKEVSKEGNSSPVTTRSPYSSASTRRRRSGKK